MMPQVVPDYSEPLVGYRAWNILSNGLLSGLYQREPWPPRHAMAARCAGSVGANEHTEHQGAHLVNDVWTPAPVVECACGIYAMRHRAMMLQTIIGQLGQAPGALYLGSVALWGRVILHQAGFRAERAYPGPGAVWLRLPDRLLHNLSTQAQTELSKTTAARLRARVLALYGLPDVGNPYDREDRELFDHIEYMRRLRTPIIEWPAAVGLPQVSATIQPFPTLPVVPPSWIRRLMGGSI